MKKTELWGSVTAVLLGVLVAVSSMGCLITGFRMEPSAFAFMSLFWLGYAVLCSLCCRLRWGLPVFAVGSLVALAIQLRWGDLLLSLEKLLNHITQYYNRAYGFGYIRWSQQSLTDVTPDSALLCLGCLILFAICVTVSRRKAMSLGSLAGIVPLILCCVVTDTVPETGFLFLLLTGLVLMILTQRLRKISLADANRLTALLLVPVVLFSGFIFRAEPEDGYEASAQVIGSALSRWVTDIADRFRSDFFQIPGATIPGATEPGSEMIIRASVDLSSAGPNHLGEHTVMEIQVAVTYGTLYLRGKSYDRYTGTSWDVTLDTAEENGWPYDHHRIADIISVKTSRPNSLRYFGYYPIDSGWEAGLENGALSNPDRLTKYQFRTGAWNASRRIKFTPLTDKEILHYTALPEATLAKAREILDVLGIDHSGVKESLDMPDGRSIQDVIADYVRSCAEYDLDTDPMPADSQDFALWFLEESSTGYCVHFASAATVLLRAAGIPARYVTGYMTSVTPDKTCLVPAYQAHAWVEYLHPKKGWTMLDATPGSPMEPIFPATEPTDPTESEPTDPSLPPDPTLPPEPTGSTEPTVPGATADPTQSGTAETTPVTTLPDATEPPSPEPIQLNLYWVEGLLWIALVWLAVAGQYKLRIRLRKKWLSTGDANRRAIKAWRYAKWLSRMTGHSAEDLLSLAEKAAYSHHSLTAEELARFDAWFLEAGEVLLEKPWVIQFLLRLIFAVE